MSLKYLAHDAEAVRVLLAAEVLFAVVVRRALALLRVQGLGFRVWGLGFRV